MGVLRDIGLWLWWLLPANPILVRVVSTGGKRTRHFWARLIYLVALTNQIAYLRGENVAIKKARPRRNNPHKSPERLSWSHY
ncbi:MAG: hypothetical protein KAY37_15635 [Phycisphaerae bacterium]|nr:hypothetical protein [Phycisphaerae bacterium]